VSDDTSPAHRSPRFAAALHAEVVIAGQPVRCEAHNLSRSGVLLVGCPVPEKAVESLELTLHAPTGDLELAVAARVARVEPADAPDETRIAVEFAGLDDKEKDVLEVLVSRVLEAHTSVALDDLPPNAKPAEIRHALAKIPIPHRVALAIRATPRERKLIRHDTHPQVLEALVRNPNLLDGEVWAIAAVRTLVPSTLELLARDPRCQRDDELKILLATHPRVPVPLAERLLRGLKLVALRKVLQKPGLNESVRGTVLRLISRSAGRG
jgi:hypothetical protein